MTRKFLFSVLLVATLVLAIVAIPLALQAANPDTVTVAQNDQGDASAISTAPVPPTPIAVASDECDGCSGGGNGG